MGVVQSRKAVAGTPRRAAGLRVETDMAGRDPHFGAHRRNGLRHLERAAKDLDRRQDRLAGKVIMDTNELPQRHGDTERMKRKRASLLTFTMFSPCLRVSVANPFGGLA